MQYFPQIPVEIDSNFLFLLFFDFFHMSKEELMLVLQELFQDIKNVWLFTKFFL